MLHETTSADHKATSNLGKIKALQKMTELLKQNGENPDLYLKREDRDLLQEHKEKEKFDKQVEEMRK